MTRLSAHTASSGSVVGLFQVAGCGAEATWAVGADGLPFELDGPVHLTTQAPHATLGLACEAVGGFRDAFWSYASEAAVAGRSFPDGWFYAWEATGEEGARFKAAVTEALDHPRRGGDLAISVVIPPEDVHVRWITRTPGAPVLCMRVRAPSGDPILYDCVALSEDAPSPDLELCKAFPVPAPAR